MCKNDEVLRICKSMFVEHIGLVLWFNINLCRDKQTYTPVYKNVDK